MIDEFISLFQPLATLSMIILLVYFVHGYLVRERKYNRYTDPCKIIYKPEKRKEDKYLFEEDDPWMRKFDPPTETNPRMRDDYDKVVDNMHRESNNVTRL